MSTSGLDAFAAGALAGIGVALPLGAIGVLLVQQGIRSGWRPAAAGATGVALVDLGYAAVALAAGSAVSRALDGRERAVQLVAATVLVAVAVRGLLTLRDRRDPGDGGPDPGDGGAGRAPALPVLGRFVGLTAVNPMTAVYFVVLTAALGDAVSGTVAAAAFVAGAFLASWGWQLVLATAGALACARLPSWARTATVVTGYVVVLGYAVALAAG